MCLSTALPASTPRYRVQELTGQISAQWKKLTREEQIEQTKDSLAAIQDERETKALAFQNVPLNAWNDTRSTLAKLEYEVSLYL